MLLSENEVSYRTKETKEVLLKSHKKNRWKYYLPLLFLLSFITLPLVGKASFPNLMPTPTFIPDCNEYGTGNGNGAATVLYYKINGIVKPGLNNYVHQGDQVKVFFTVSGSQDTYFTLVSYKAPDSTFNPSTAKYQEIFDVDSKIVSCGQSVDSLTVMVPNCYFQIDFVKGCAIQKFDEPTNKFYSPQERLYEGDNGGTQSCCQLAINLGPDTTVRCSTSLILTSPVLDNIDIVYQWTTKGGNIVTSSKNNWIMVNASGTYYLTVTDTGNGCMAMDSIIVLFDQIKANAGNDTVINCLHRTITLHGNSNDPSAALSWTANPGNIVSSTGADAVVNAAGTYIFSAVDGNCYDTDTLIVSVDTIAPDVHAGPDKVLNCTVLQVQLEGSSSTSGTTYTWSTITGNIVVGGKTLTPTVDAAGTYTLLVYNPSNGCSAKDSAVVTVNRILPDAYAGLDKILNCIATSTHLEGSSSTLDATYLWSTTTGHIVSGINTLMPLVDAAGTYTLTVFTAGNGCSAKDSTVVISTITPPNVNAGTDKILNCTTTQVNLSGSSTTPSAEFSWTVTGGGHIVSGANTATPIVNAAGTYTLVVTNPQTGCTASDYAVVTLDTTPPVVDLGADISQCGGSVVLDAGNAGSTYLWSTTETTQTITVSASGTYTVVVTGPNNGCTASDEIVVNINPYPIVDLGQDAIVPPCDSLILHAGNSGSTISWNTGASTESIVVKTTGTYSVTVTNGFGCVATDEVHVTITPFVSLGPDTIVGHCLKLSSGQTASSNATIEWCDGQTYPTEDACKTGVYCITVTTSTCRGVDTVVVVVVNLGADTTLSAPSTTLDAGYYPGLDYLWSTGETTQKINVTTPGSYAVEVSSKTLRGMAKDTINILAPNTAGIADRMGKNAFNLYPNPNTGEFSLNFSVNKKQNVEVKVMNYLGAVVYKEVNENFVGDYKKNINVNGNNAGVYIMQVSYDGTVYSNKFVIIK